MNTGTADPLKFPTIPLILGILSGFATAGAARFWSGLNPFVGIFFGIAVLFTVWLNYKKCSVWLVTALLTSSVASYCAAIWGTAYLLGMIGRVLGPENSLTDPFGPTEFSIAGYLGAVIFNIALLWLFSEQKTPVVFGKAAAWAAAGAFFGLISAELAEYVGAAVAVVVGIPRTDMGTNGYYTSLYSAYLIWQTGMAFLISLMLPKSSVAEPGQAVSAPRSLTGLSISGKLFFSCILATVAAVSYFSIRNLYHTWKYQHETETLLGETPSVLNLPAVEPKPLEQMLILHEIGGFAEAGTSSNIVPAYTVNIGPMARPHKRAERIVYRIGYKNSESTYSPPGHEMVMVTVSELPNVDWARYQLRAGPAYDGQLLYSESTKVNRFGASVFVYPTKPGSTIPTRPLDQYVYWLSENKVVAVYHSGQPAAEEVIKQYLAKYPSSL